MADNVVARKNGDWNSISILPDVCKTPMGGTLLPVPYPVTSNLAPSVGTTGSVKANSDTVVAFDKTKMPKTEGDAPGTGKGVKSGTVGKDTWPQDKSSTVKAEDKKVVRNDDKTEMNGDFASKEEEEKAKRQKCRQEQAEAGKQSADPKVRAAADRFSRDIKSAEHARLAEHVYNPSNPAPTGWNNISNDPAALSRYGLTQNELNIPGTNFRAQVYEPNSAVFGDTMRPAVVFQGTSGTGDWGANIRQGLNMESAYYQRAVGIGNVLHATNSNVDIVGHSLGGGLASATSQAGGFPATTFNAAGLHSRTVPGYGVVRGNPRMVNAYRVDNEILTSSQEGGWKSSLVAAAMGPVTALTHAFGTWMAPDGIGNKFALPGSGTPLARHGMDQVIRGIEGEKTQDQQTIAKDTGKEC